MIKFSSGKLLAILRKFKLAGDQHSPRHIEDVNVISSDETATLVHFKYNKRFFYLFTGDDAPHSIDLIASLIATHQPDVKGEFLDNPAEPGAFTVQFDERTIYLYAVKPQKTRLDSFLAEHYPDSSRSTWQKHIKAGHVSVNGTIVQSVKHDIIDTDAVSIEIPDATDHSDKEFPILYLDDDVIVINKPVGALTHAKGALNDEFTVADFFRRYTTYHLETNRPGIVHRLDRDTSGIIIGARNPETALLLQKQFAQRLAKKTYAAIVDGHPKHHQATIDLPIGRNPSAPSTFRVDPKGKPAQTSYAIVDTNDRGSLLKLQPKTGRTHQLRVHTSHLNTPIHGDKVYGKAADRMYLHALSLEITIPPSTRKIFTAPLPASFLKDFSVTSL